MELKYYLKDSSLKFEEPQTGDAGYDIQSAETYNLKAGETYLFSTSLYIRIPEGHVGLMKERSGMGIKGISLRAGVIDSGYTGEVKVALSYLHPHLIYQWEIGESELKVTRPVFASNLTYNIAKGDKIAQILIVPISISRLIVSTDLGQTERGNKGFGSSGV